MCGTIPIAGSPQEREMPGDHTAKMKGEEGSYEKRPIYHIMIGES
jgi:hypothetical protein